MGKWRHGEAVTQQSWDLDSGSRIPNPFFSLQPAPLLSLVSLGSPSSSWSLPCRDSMMEVPSTLCLPLGSRVPAAALGTAASELSLRHLPV